MSHERISPTAHYTAYVWQRLELPHAELFATRTGAALYWGFFAVGEWATRLSTRVPSMRDYLEYRHRLIESVVEELVPDCLVELGAGLSRRGVTWAADHGTRAVEVDLPHMAAAKREALQRASPGLLAMLEERHRVVDGNVLAEDFADVLAGLLREAERPVIVAEGLLSYFDPPDRAALFRSVAAALEGRGAFICDLHTADAQAEVGNAAAVLRFAIRTITRRRRAIDPYANEGALRDALLDAGFGSVELVEARDYVAREPRLASVRSPAHVVVARPPVAAA